jgi:hypothetical protein
LKVSDSTILFYKLLDILFFDLPTPPKEGDKSSLFKVPPLEGFREVKYFCLVICLFYKNEFD